jgi:aminomuconate-semialdehyde/2-hydroxymuconate-6-semialdehyde dehydrogenase
VPDFRFLEEQITSGRPVEIPPALRQWLDTRRKLFIGGEWVDGGEGKTFLSMNPATEQKLAEIAIATQSDVDRAVKSARSAYTQGDWSHRSLTERAAVVRRLGDLILQHRAPLALLESLDSGKPIRESYEGDIPRAAQNFHFFAELALQEPSPSFPAKSEVHFAQREPLGVVALITPWNLPLYLETWKLAPALMMGNSCILKPSELTPLTACCLAELAQEAGVPPGVFQLLQGFGEKATGEWLTSHPGVDAISFTGETGTGRAIMKAASVGPTRVSFELGGKGASIVFADAPIEQAVAESARAAFRNQGEICLACPRLFVAREIWDEFVPRFLARVKEISVGNPLDYGTTMGALISADHLAKVTRYLEGLSADQILTGGSRPASIGRGYFLSPTVVTGVGPEHPISREEIFGPVVSLYPFDDEKTAIELANDTPYGLSASIWTRDLQRAHRVARKLHIGMVWVNCWFVRDLRVPFGGQKRSGVGREGGTHSLDFFSEWKSICIKSEGVT